MRHSVEDLFSKDNRISVGDRVELESFGQKYIGTVGIAVHSKNQYIVQYHDRFSGNARVGVRRRHELDVVNDNIILEPEFVDYAYDNDFVIESMV